MKTSEINFSPDIISLFNRVSKEEIENALRKAFPQYQENEQERTLRVRQTILERYGKPRPEPIIGIEKSMEMIRNQNFLNFDPEE